MEDAEVCKDTQRTFFNYYLRCSKRGHEFPTVRDAKRYSGIPINRSLSEFGINLDDIKAGVLKKRIPEIFAENPDLTVNEFNDELGVNINNWLDKIRYKSYSDLRKHYTGKASRRRQRVFESKEKAVETIENFCFRYLMKNKRLPSVKRIQKKLKIDRNTYVEPEEMKYIKARVIGEALKKFLRENSEIKKDELEARFGVNLDIWVKQLGYDKYSNLRDAYRQEIEGNVKEVKRRFVGIINQGNTLEEKDKILSTYSDLITELVKPKSEKRTTLLDMEKYISEKTGNPPNSFDVSIAKEYSRATKRIEGNASSGYYK